MKRSPEEVNKTLYRHKNSLNEHEGLLTSYVFRKILVFVFILTDFVTLFSLFDAILVENLYMALIFTFSCTLCYNYMPVVMANEINARRADKEHSLTMLYISAAVFAVIASATAILRLTTREAMFFSPFDGTEDYSGIMNQLSVQPDSPAAYTATIVMAIIPIGTSLVSFWLTLKDDPYSVAIYRNKKALNKLEQKRITLQSEVERYKDRDMEAELLTWEQLSHDSFIEQSFAETDSVNQYFVTLLTTKTKTADSVSFATEEPLGLDHTSENVKHLHSA